MFARFSRTRALAKEGNRGGKEGRRGRRRNRVEKVVEDIWLDVCEISMRLPNI